MPIHYKDSLIVTCGRHAARIHKGVDLMTVKQQIAQARQHLAIGNDYSYRALMSASIHSAMSTRSINRFYKALAADGYEVRLYADASNIPCPTYKDIQVCTYVNKVTAQGHRNANYDKYTTDVVLFRGVL